MILEHAIMPSIATSSSDANLIPTTISTNSIIPVAPIPMVLQPQQVLLSMPGGALITSPVSAADNSSSLQTRQETITSEPSHQLGTVRQPTNSP